MRDGNQADEMNEREAALRSALLLAQGDMALPTELQAAIERRETCYSKVTLEQSAAAAYCAEHEITLSTLLCGVFGFVLTQYKYQEAAVFCTQNARTGGLMPILCEINDGDTVVLYLRRVQRQMEMFAEYGGDAFAKAEKEGQLRPDVFFCRENTSATGALISLRAEEKMGAYQFRLEYRADLYRRETVQTVLDVYGEALNGFLRSETFAEVNLLTTAAKQLLASFNNTAYPVEWAPVTQRIARHAAQTPEKIAVISRGQSLTYAQLDANSSRTANFLLARGICPEQPVGVILPRTAAVYAARQGILKSGAAFMPISPDYPDERIRYIMDDSKAPYLITNARIKAERSALWDSLGCEVFTIEEVLGCENTADPAVEIQPDGLCYCMYTSGSTGKPKGVMIRHGNLLNYCDCNPKSPETAAYVRLATVSLAFAAFTFDVSILEEFVPLVNGLRVCMADEEEIQNPLALAKLILENGVDAMTATPSYLSNVIDIDEMKLALSQIKIFNIGAENFPEALYLKIRRLGSNARVVNCYGPTETTVGCTAKKIADGKITIGVPICNTKIYMLSKYGVILPVGAFGELTIAGAGVGRGYIGKPELTKEKFIVIDGQNAYRSGDVARWNASGEIEFVGRMDNQVKLRGLRVELDEIQSAINAFGGVSTSVVVVKDSENGQFLCGYFSADHKVDTTALTEYLTGILTQYMVPSVLVQLDQMPLTANGKIDKKALPEPKIAIKQRLLPQNELQRQIFAVLSSVVGHEEFGCDTDIFRAGLTSLGVMKLNILLAKAFDLEFSAKTVNTYHTVLKLEDYILHAARESKTYEARAAYPLTQTQLGIYLQCIEDDSSVFYNIPALFDFSKNMDGERLQRAITAAVDAHSYIKLRICVMDDAVVQIPKHDDMVNLAYYKLTETEFQRKKESLVRPFALTSGVLYRFELYETEQRFYLFFDIHHIICDGESQMILMADIDKAYRGEILEAENYNSFMVAADEESARSGEALNHAKAFYDAKFKEIETEFAFPFDLPPGGGAKLGMIEREAASVPIAAVDMFCRKHRVTPNAFFLGAFGYLLSKYQNQKEAVFCTIYDGRKTSKIADTVGMLVKTWPLSCDFHEDRSIVSYLTDIREQTLLHMEHDIYSFGEISRAYGIKVEVLFAYQGDAFEKISVGTEQAESKLLRLDAAKAPLTLLVYIERGKYLFSLEYAGDRYHASTMENMLDTYEEVLGAFLTARQLSNVNLLSETAQKVLQSFNETAFPVRRDQSVVGLFREQAARTPDHLAVVYQAEKLTYRALDALTDRLGKYIKAQGIGREDAVGILINRSTYMVIAALGALKAGAAYQPLDPSYPQERLDFMLRDSGAKLLITEEDLCAKVAGYGGEVLFTTEIAALEDREDIKLGAPRPEDLFILLYTSGSTGTPKGCMLEHRNLVQFCTWFNHAYEISADSRVAAYASFGFDASMMDVYPTLTGGGCVHIIPEEIRLDLIALNAYFLDNGITNAFMTTQVGRQFAAGVENSTLKYLLTGGEKLGSCKPPSYQFINIYGPTECTVFVTRYAVETEVSLPPIGRPVGNAKIYIIDENARLLPPGMPGELCISGYSVGRGYLNRADLTEQVFVKNPFSDAPGYERMYKTGDICRYLADGDIEYVGRRDAQVKIRGFRIELTEIESKIRDYDGIKNAAVVAFDNADGGKYIAAYIVSDEKIDIKRLHSFIAAEKPAYMVPAVTMQIDAIPLNQNQKVNKKALPAPQVAADVIVKPENAMQQLLWEIVSRVIGHAEFGIDTDIYLAGLTSIGALRLNLELAKAFDLPIAMKELKKHSTVRKLESYLQSGDHPAEDTWEKQSDYPLTQTQLGVYLDSIRAGASTIYNIPAIFKLATCIDLEKLSAAIHAAFNAHPAIKCRLAVKDMDIVQMRRDEDAVTIDRIECGEDEISQEIKKFVRPFQLNAAEGEAVSPPLYRVQIAKTPERLYLFLDIHHLICDGVSLTILVDDIDRAYAGEALQPESYTSFDLALSEQKMRAGDAYTRAAEYYKKLFGTVNSDASLPFDKREPVERSAFYRRIEEGLSTEAVEAFCAARRISPNVLFLGAFAFVLSQYKHQEEISFCTIYNGRSNSRLARVVGMLVKTLPLYHDFSQNESIAAYLDAVKDQVMHLMDHDIYSFGEASREFGIKPDILFAYQGDNFSEFNIGGNRAEMLEAELSTAQAPLSIDIYIKSGKYSFQTAYRGDLYEEATVRLLTDVYIEALRSFLTALDFKEVKLLSAEAKARLAAYNATDAAVEEIPVTVQISAQSRSHPEKQAIVSRTQALTFKEMETAANRLANALLARKIKPEQLIGAMIPRDVYAYAVRQGILKAGAAFLSLDPGYPDDRIRYILEDSRAPYLMMTEALKRERAQLCLGLDCEILTVEALFACENGAEPEVVIDTRQLAYCIYTSGSTGNPKGVMITHRNLLHYCHANAKNPEIMSYVHHATVSLALAALTFDVSILEEFVPLVHGITVCIADEEEIHNPLALSALIMDRQVDMMTCTPSFLLNIIDLDELRPALSRIKAFNVGAESFPQPLYEKIKALDSGAHVYNGYGPTEATIGCTFTEVRSGKITIGKPMSNVKIHMLNAYDQILPPGMPGELTIIGAGVGRGYINKAALTAEKFIAVNGEPAYRSGDLARWNTQGEIEFNGRIDDQVKLHGLRIELGEIGSVMNRYEGITSSIVLVKENAAEQFLCAYFAADRPIDKDALSRYLSATLTHYMVPNVFMQMDKIPLTNNGKVDKKLLPEPDFTVKEREYAAPENETEAAICAIVQQVLRLKRVGATDNFFELGGTSLSASILAMKAMASGLGFVYGDIFKYPTPRLLASFANADREVAATVAPTDTVADYDYEKFNDLLKSHTLDRVDAVVAEDIGDILLTGATGFLGIHVLKEYLDHYEGKVYCLVRKGRAKSPEARLKALLMYYFEETWDALFGHRIILLDGDITNAATAAALARHPFKTLINCAACVKHFASDDILHRSNVQAVQNLLKLCRETGRRFVQISTTSIGGDRVDDHIAVGKVLQESEVYFGQSITNQYVESKFLAERAVLEAALEGVDVKIMRVGNLMSRDADGEFQINFLTNGFMRTLRGYKVIGKFPMTQMFTPAEFSPVDATATAILALVGTNRDFIVYHPYNNHYVNQADVIDAMNRYGFKIDVVSEAEFQQAMHVAMQDAKRAPLISGLIAYLSSDQTSAAEAIEADNRFTVEILFRLGRKWPITSDQYLQMSVKALDQLGFFDETAGTK